MRTRFWIAALSLLAWTASASAARFPVAFEANQGQWPADVRFAARGQSAPVFLREGGVDFGSVRMSFAGARQSPPIDGFKPLAYVSHHFVGNDPSAWRTGIRSYSQVVYSDLYPGIDALFYSGDAGELEYDFIVRPGSDPRSIILRFDDAASVTTDRGDLLVRAGANTIRMKAPAMYQMSGQRRTAIAGRYRILEDGAVGFIVGRYDRSRDLVIDPVVLGFSTFLGGTSSDAAFGIAVDVDRYTYIVGVTESASFPAKDGFSQTIAGSRDVFVAKLTPAGDQIVFSTFLGGTGMDSPGGDSYIALDSRGDIYVGGQTASRDFPVTPDAPQTSFGGGPNDAFVAKLSGDGSRLLFSTYLGGEGMDRGRGVAADSAHHVYLGGVTTSSGFPVTDGAFQKVRRGNQDAFVAKFRIDPPTLVFSTYLGGSADDTGHGLAVDATGAAYLIGPTLSSDFPTTEGVLQRAFAGAGTGGSRYGDAFVTKLDPSGSSLIYSTYLGGLSGEIATSIAVDLTGAAHVTGLTCSRDFPTTAGSYQAAHGGGDCEDFVAKLARDARNLVFSTYLGGNNSEQANAIAVDPLGNVHVSGTSSSSNFPTTSDALSRTRKGSNDGTVSILSADGSQLLYSTYLGGTAPSGGPQDNLWSIAVDQAGNTYVGGQTRSVDFPVAAGAVQSVHHGSDDAYIVKFMNQRELPKGELRVVPVVGSGAGALGSFFRTSFQLHNPRDVTIGGRITFHPQASAASDSHPHFDYFLRPRETIGISDLLPAMGESGLGSIDLITREGEGPQSVIRIFNDAGQAGTTGMSEQQVAMDEVLDAGTTAILIAPPSMARARFNIGIRTLGDGASVSIEVRNSNGASSQILTRSYPPNWFEQRSAADFLGIAPGPSDSIAFRIESGSAVIYGATTDNTSQDPSLQLARPVHAVTGETRPFLLVVGSTPGALGSFFKTSVQLHNPGSTAISGFLVYHSQNRSGSDTDPSIVYSLQPGETISYDDLLPAMNSSGLGSLDLIPTSGFPPISVARIYNDAGERGTTGMTEDQVSSTNVLWRGDQGIILAPRDPAAARLNIGIRTLGEGAVIAMTIRSASGNLVKTVTKTFDPDFFTQMPATALLETELHGNESVTLRIETGSAVIYGATIDNITQDPTLSVVRRLD